MPSFVCARCTLPATRMRNSALCQGCWHALADAGLRWCPRCKTVRPLFADRGYCADCRRALDRERNQDPAYRARKRAGERARRAAMTINRCAQCGALLTPKQQNNENRCCSPRCARLWTYGQPPPCQQCGQPTPAKGRKFCGVECSKAYRRHEARPHTPTPSPVAPVAPEPAQRATAALGAVLGREGATVYTVGSLNGRPYVFDGPGRAYCALSAWAASAAARRIGRMGERSVFDEVKAVSVWRKYPREVEG